MRRSRRLPVVVLVAVLALVLAGAIALGVYWIQRDTSADTGAGAETPAAEAPVAAPSLLVDAVIDGDVVRMTEATRLGESGADTAELQVPQLAELTGAAGSARLEVTDLVVTLDGERVEPTQDPAAPGVWQVVRPDGEPFREMKVGYTLLGAVVTSPLSAEGRMLAVLGPISPTVADQPATATVRGSGLLNVFCPGVAADELLCGTQAGDTWTAELAGQDPRERVLLVQIERG